MKKLLFLSFLICLALVGFSQASVKLPLAAGDTITNTGTSSKTLIVTSGPSGVFFQDVLTKLSGTGAGTIQLQVSLDGITFTNSGTAYTITNTFPQAATFSIVAPVPQYLRLLATGTGSESVVQTLWYRAPKFQAP